MAFSLPKTSRRGFLHAGGQLTVGLLAGVGSLRASEGQPSDRLRIAIIGCGGRGRTNMGQMAGEDVVALCDVNESHLKRAAEQHTKAATFRDFRRMYDALRDNDFDAVVVSTTEHTHAFATYPALARHKHVYCEKPLTHSVHEARLITQLAEQAGVATQMGIQIHAGDNYRRVVELVQYGAIGSVTEVHVWVGRAWGWQSPADAKKNRDIVSVQDRPQEAEPVPDGLDWDLWLGPAPERPYHSVYFPGPKWYRWWDFGNGTMSDLGSHWLDLPFWALQLDAPTSIDASGPPPHAEIAPASMRAVYQYGRRGDMPPVTVSWYQGAAKPELWQRGEIPQWGSGCLFVGNQGMLLADYGKHVLLPEEQFADFEPPQPTIPASIGHHAEWLHACRTGAKTTCHFGYSGPLTEANHLGNVAFRAGQPLTWDARQMKIPNVPEAERFLGRSYRPGWTLG